MNLSFFLAVLLAGRVHATNAQSHIVTHSIRCFGSVTQRDDNVPVSMSDDGHSVAHAAAIFEEQHLLAWIFEDKNTTKWFVGNSDSSLRRPEIENAAAIMGVPASEYANASSFGDDVLRGYAIPLTRPISLTSVADVPITIIRCW